MGTHQRNNTYAHTDIQTMVVVIDENIHYLLYYKEFDLSFKETMTTLLCQCVIFIHNTKTFTTHNLKSFCNVNNNNIYIHILKYKVASFSQQFSTKK
jgi:hypothetical protein